MALPSGLARQFGYKIETTAGTAVTPDVFVPWVDGNGIEVDIARLESEGAIAGRRFIDTDQWKSGNHTLEGDVGIEVYEQSIGPLLRLALGTVSTTGAGPYTHTFTPTYTGVTATCQFGKPDVTGTVRPFTYAGVQVAEWELNVSAGEILTMGLSLVGYVQETTGTALATASYAAQATRPFVAREIGTATIGGTNTNIKSFSLKGNQGFDADRFFLGARTTAKPLPAERYVVEGTVELEFEDLTAYNRYVNGTEADVIVTATNGAGESFSVNAHCRFDGSSPSVDGDGLVTLSQPIKAIGDGADTDAVTVTYVSDDATV